MIQPNLPEAPESTPISGITIGYRITDNCAQRIESCLLQTDPSLKGKDLFSENAENIIRNAPSAYKIVWQWLRTKYAPLPKDNPEEAARCFFLQSDHTFLDLDHDRIEELLSCILSQISEVSPKRSFRSTVLDITTRLIKNNIDVLEVQDPQRFIAALRNIIATEPSPMNTEVIAEILLNHSDGLAQLAPEEAERLISYLESRIVPASSPEENQADVPDEFEKIRKTLTVLVFTIGVETRKIILETLRTVLPDCIKNTQKDTQKG